MDDKVTTTIKLVGTTIYKSLLEECWFSEKPKWSWRFEQYILASSSGETILWESWNWTSTQFLIISFFSFTQDWCMTIIFISHFYIQSQHCETCQIDEWKINVVNKRSTQCLWCRQFSSVTCVLFVALIFEYYQIQCIPTTLCLATCIHFLVDSFTYKEHFFFSTRLLFVYTKKLIPIHLLVNVLALNMIYTLNKTFFNTCREFVVIFLEPFSDIKTFFKLFYPTGCFYVSFNLPAKMSLRLGSNYLQICHILYNCIEIMNFHYTDLMFLLSFT